MARLVKILVGDRYNAGAVAVAVMLDWALTSLGKPVLADFLTPVTILAAATWLARR